MILETNAQELNDLKKLYERTLRVSKHKKLLNKAVIDFDKAVHPLEFESYYNYFQIKAFEKGFSESGIVDLDEVRNKDRPLYYTKLLKKDNNQQVPSRDLNKKDTSKDIKANSNSLDEKSGSSRTTGIRRSLRLNKTPETTASEKETEGGVEENILQSQHSSNKPSNLHLPEDVVPKVVAPIRRSDVILPPKNRYIRERQPPIKPVSSRLLKYSAFISRPSIKKFIHKCSNGEYDER